MSVDFLWCSNGGLLLDGSGDIAITQSPLESLRDMVNTRLKAALDGWKLYRIGADLDRVIGETVSPEIELRIQRQVQTALTRDLFPSGTFQVKTLAAGAQITIFVYLQQTLVTTANVNLKPSA